MAIAKVKKVEFIASNQHKKAILEEIQKSGVFHISDISDDFETTINDNELSDLQQSELLFANANFAIKVLTPYEKKKGLFPDPITLTEEELVEKAKNVNIKDITKKCTEQEDAIIKAKNENAILNEELKVLEPWKNLKTSLKNRNGSDNYASIFVLIKATNYEKVVKDVIEITNLSSIEKVSDNEKDIAAVIIFDREYEKEIKKILVDNKAVEAELPETDTLVKDYIHNTKEKIHSNEKQIKESEKELEKLAKHLDDLKILHDYLLWDQDKLNSNRKIGSTNYTFAIKGWMPEKNIPAFKEKLQKISNEFELTEITPTENETAPVIIKNSRVTNPFETLTKMYGLPKYNELDPTPYLSIFFVIYFALCLTDAGYGILMFVATFMALKFIKLGEGIKKLVRLLMYGGIFTTIIGILFGGWFGLTAEEVPAFLTYTTASGEQFFLLQQINAVTNPLAVLILSLALGYLQILVGIFMKFIHDFKTGNKLDAVLDTGTWAFMLTGIAVFVLGAAGVLPTAEIGKWWVIAGAALLILTQGRASKNIVGKFFTGVLSLYGLVGYMSDVLSYSRLLALGLATAIIGLAVNVIVNLAGGIPYIGWLLAAIIFVGGHLFNLLINTLGSFIHSGRLQFVEFFSKFMEGGGKEFTPLERKTKYVFIKQ
ncbi:hypothetical protein GF340_01990 [Candidatus Peregrinibacteria bacterium]|nr:hypothetical protein [Candidatus Peregrinibacteria bacterium]